VVRAADCLFLYLSQKCRSDVVSIRRGSVLAAILALMGANAGAASTFRRCAENGVRSGEDCMIQMVLQLQSFVGWVLLACAVLFAVSCWFERAIANREREWKYFSSGVALTSEGSHQT
jgi:hypothetical protein